MNVLYLQKQIQMKKLKLLDYLKKMEKKYLQLEMGLTMLI